jgi:hypothetical protein
MNRERRGQRRFGGRFGGYVPFAVHNSIQPDKRGGYEPLGGGCHEQPPLELIVGELDNPWVVLEPGDPPYERFLFAWLFQGDWGWAQHSGYFETHIGDWPLAPRRRSTSGLVAQRVAAWRRAGFSRSQITTALGFASLTRKVWDLADTYRDWLAERPYLHPRGIFGMTHVEDLYATAYERRGDDESALAFRRNYRALERTPRVVTSDERTRSGFSYFGYPEHISSKFLDELDPARTGVRANLDRAERELYAQEPRSTPRRSPRRTHRTPAERAA